jgi:hypothetical protein
MTPSEIITTVITSVGGSAVIVGGVAAWLGKIWADRIVQSQKFLQDIDLDLRKRRLEVYGEIWEATALLPKWPRANDVTYEKLLEFSTSLRTWYFKKGGMYLSRSTQRDAYSTLQDKLSEILVVKKSGPISPEHYGEVRERCSALRTALASDIQSRREGHI